jgi:cytochrome P450
MGIVDEIKETVQRLGDEKDRAIEAVSEAVGAVADRTAGDTFAQLRRHDPIFTAGPTTVVTLNQDVKEVLENPTRFTVGLYGPKMTALTGPFILGVDDTPLYHHDHAAMDRAVTREDLPRLGNAMYDAARDLVAPNLPDGEIDVVSQLAAPALDRVVGDYFGTPGPDNTRWAHDAFYELFINVGNLPTIRERALATAAEWRPHLDRQIEARKEQLAAGEDVPDDVLTRLLRYQSEGEPNFHDIAIRHNILGNITGWLPTISNAFARVVEELLEREDELARAQEAARAGDRELVGAYVFEASRFRPQNFALLRLVPEDTTIAAGTERETKVKAGSTVFAATLSAMHDETAIDSPEEFRVDRPWSDYMLFGHGMHACYGQQIVRRQLPALATALLEGPKIERARGDDGKLRFDGPFPSGLTVRFEAGGHE